MVSRMPMTLKLRGLTTKFLLRRFARGRLPETVLRRPKKGFSVPLALWFKGPWKEKLRKELLRGTGTSVLFDPMVIGRLLKEHESGWRDHSMKLWGLLILSLWHKEHLE
jgi:asparagine synthase (glutamine-hydrolysing)